MEILGEGDVMTISTISNFAREDMVSRHARGAIVTLLILSWTRTVIEKEILLVGVALRSLKTSRAYSAAF